MNPVQSAFSEGDIVKLKGVDLSQQFGPRHLVTLRGVPREHADAIAKFLKELGEFMAPWGVGEAIANQYGYGMWTSFVVEEFTEKIEVSR